MKIILLLAAAAASTGIFVFLAMRYLAQKVRLKKISYSIKDALPDVGGAHAGLKEKVRGFKGRS